MRQWTAAAVALSCLLAQAAAGSLKSATDTGNRTEDELSHQSGHLQPLNASKPPSGQEMNLAANALSGSGDLLRAYKASLLRIRRHERQTALPAAPPRPRRTQLGLLRRAEQGSLRHAEQEVMNEVDREASRVHSGDRVLDRLAAMHRLVRSKRRKQSHPSSRSQLDRILDHVGSLEKDMHETSHSQARPLAPNASAGLSNVTREATHTSLWDPKFTPILVVAEPATTAPSAATAQSLPSMDWPHISFSTDDEPRRPQPQPAPKAIERAAASVAHAEAPQPQPASQVVAGVAHVEAPQPLLAAKSMDKAVAGVARVAEPQLPRAAKSVEQALVEETPPDDASLRELGGEVDRFAASEGAAERAPAA